MAYARVRAMKLVACALACVPAWREVAGMAWSGFQGVLTNSAVCALSADTTMMNYAWAETAWPG
jgi:hypothetical protein